MPGDSGVLVVTRVRSATTKGTRDRGCIAPRDCEVAFVIGAGTRNACPGCCATPTPSARSRASSTRYVLRRGALLIRVHCALRIALGPGSAVHREERCTASGTRNDASTTTVFGCLKIGATVAAHLIPIVRRLNKPAIPGRTDQDLVDADPWRHAGDEGDGAAEVFRLQHSGLFFFRWHHRPQFQDRGCDLARRQAARPQAVDAFIHV